MTKVQLKEISKMLNYMNKPNSKYYFTVQSKTAYFSVDGITGYEIPMDNIYQVTDQFGIKMSEPRGTDVIIETFNRIYSKDYCDINLDIKEFSKELRDYYKQSKADGKLAFYTINYQGHNQTFNSKIVADAIKVLGNKSRIFLDWKPFNCMYIYSKIGSAVIQPIKTYKEFLPNKMIGEEK